MGISIAAKPKGNKRPVAPVWGRLDTIVTDMVNPPTDNCAPDFVIRKVSDDANMRPVLLVAFTEYFPCGKP